MKTNGSGSYNQGIRINRVSTNSWALLLIGKSGDATSGTGTTTAGDGAWLIGTPASSNSLIFNLNDASENKGLCLKGHGDNDIKWNNNTIWHAANDGSGSELDADLLDGYHASYFHIQTAKSYTSVDAIPSGNDGWYNIFTINDSTYGAAICTIKAVAHSSLTFIVSKGYSTSSTLQILQYNASVNGSYFYVKGVRILSNGKVQALFNKPSANNNVYISVNINIFSSNGTLTPNTTLTLETSTLDGSTTPSVLRSLTGMHNKITSDIVGNASSADKWSTNRTLTIGNTVSGSADVSWSLSEIGAAAAEHNHDSVYVKKAGDTMTGSIIMSLGTAILNPEG